MKGLLPISCALLCLCACEERVSPPPPPRGDASALDAGPRDAMVVPRRDGGPTGLQIDGVIGEREWVGAVSASADVATDRPGSTLSRLRALLDGDRLLVAVDVTLADGDALVVYVDRALDEPDGVSDLGTLTDEDGALDAALTQAITTPSRFAADVAFGTTRMMHTAVGLDDEQGWRTLGSPAMLGWQAAELAPVACGDVACEAAIPLSLLGGEAPRTLALFARIVASDGALTNQTLPRDDSGRPANVSMLLTLDEDAPVDAGTPFDAGTDAGGTPGVTVDGTIDASEWSAATRFTASTTPNGGFVGNQLTSLYALRDASRLYLAIEGSLTSGNAIAIYVDHDYGGGDGLASPTPLDDFVGELDRALSKAMLTPADLRLDFAWGTLDLGRAALATDDRMGWRDVGANPSLYRAIDGTRAPTVCSATACETSISLADLGVLAGDDVALYARLVSGSSAAFSNQTLPLDDTSAPELISTFATLSPP